LNYFRRLCILIVWLNFVPHVIVRNFFKLTRFVLNIIFYLGIIIIIMFFFVQIIGSSILFVHDETKASLWMIDFGKTRLLPDNIHITHLNSWIRNSHEDGYLFGIDNLILIFEEIIDELRL
jgi:1D-myo-inositol-triphosphate 3-kinase